MKMFTSRRYSPSRSDLDTLSTIALKRDLKEAGKLSSSDLEKLIVKVENTLYLSKSLSVYAEYYSLEDRFFLIELKKIQKIKTGSSI